MKGHGGAARSELEALGFKGTFGMSKPILETNRTDIIAALARGVASACPIIGGLIAEAVNQIIPNQKVERVIDYLRLLDQKIAALNEDFGRVADRLRDERGLDLFEDGILQAARAISQERREHLASFKPATGAYGSRVGVSCLLLGTSIFWFSA
jgi:hypothetical protein